MRVGTSVLVVLALLKPRDHPHACGDKHQSRISQVVKRGSSPCVWGQVSYIIRYIFVIRIIPMRVGTSVFDDIISYIIRDHPHACGDKCATTGAAVSCLGSSPCVWGQVLSNTNYRRFRRIIPMRVGTSGYFCVVIRVVWDHPHACGDKKTSSLEKLEEEGSSPCVWGQDS